MNPAFPVCPELLEVYDIRDEVGKGSFGVVYKALHRITQIYVAIKCVLKSSMPSPDHISRFMREVSIMKMIDHPFTAQFFDLVDTEDAFYIVLEYIENENLLIHIQNGGPLPEPTARRYFSQIVSVLDYLHNIQHIAHRDLKAENILLDKNNNIRIIDFGLSNVFTETTPLLKTACGSPAYAAPEMLKGQRYSKSADIWSAGIVLYAMVTGHLPFYDDNQQELLKKIIYQQPVYPPTFSFPLNDLLHKMLMKSPTDRIKLDRVKEHPWFSQCEIKSVLKVSFATDRYWKVGGTPEQIDRDIVEQMAGMGLDTTKLHHDLLNHEQSQLTTVYRILKRDHLTDQMKVLSEAPPMHSLPESQQNLQSYQTNLLSTKSAARPNQKIEKPDVLPFPKPVVIMNRQRRPSNEVTANVLPPSRARSGVVHAPEVLPRKISS